MKLFELNIATGTLTTTIGTVGTNTNFTYFKGNKGLALKGVNTNTLVFTNALIGVKTIVFAIKKGTNTKLFLDNTTDKLQISSGSISGTGLTGGYVNGTSTYAVANNIYQLVIAEFSGGISFASNFKIAPTANIELPFKIICYDSLLSEQERDTIQRDFNNLQPLDSPKALDYTYKATDLSKESGIVAGYNFICNGTTIVDISGNLKNATTVGKPMMTKNGLQLNGTNQKVTVGNIGNVKSIAFRIKPSSTTCKIMEGQANAKTIYINSGTLTAADFANIYINGVAGTAMVANQWQNVVLTSASDVAFTACSLGINNTTYGKFEIEILKFYNRTLTLQEAKDFNNQFAKRITLKENFQYEGAYGVAKVPTGWIKTSGSFKIGQFTSGIPPLPTFKIGQKYLECLTAGVISIPSKQAYGTWQWDFYKGADANGIDIYFTNAKTTGTTGYKIGFSTAEAINLYAAASSLMSSASFYIANNTWYSVKVTRTLAGIYTVYVKGGSYGTATWTQVTASSGSNPATNTTYTTSEYLQVNLQAGDRITNIKFTEGIEV